MLDKLIKEVVKGAAEVATSPITLADEVFKKVEKKVSNFGKQDKK